MSDHETRIRILNTGALYRDIVADVPQLRRGKVWCTTCGREEDVNAADRLASGWPKCCGYTMTVDSPDERAGADETKEEA